MSIIFDEYAFAEHLLETGFTKCMSMSDLTILAKYYKYHGENRIYVKLVEFCNKFNPDFNEVIFGKRLEIAVRNANKYAMKLPFNIKITEEEINKIRSIDNYRYEKILFTMLVIARYNKKNSRDYYTNEKMATILKLARVYATKAEKAKLKNDLYKLGMIEAVLGRNVSKESYRLLYAQEDSPTAIEVVDLSNPTQYYKPLCEICKKEIVKRGQNHRMCGSCFKEHRRTDVRLNVQKYRNQFNSQLN